MYKAESRKFYLAELVARTILSYLIKNTSWLGFLGPGGFFYGLAVSVLVKIISKLIMSGIIKIDLALIDKGVDSDRNKYGDAVDAVWREIDNAKKLNIILTDESKAEYRKAIIEAATDFINLRDKLIDDGLSDEWKDGVFNS